MTLLLTQAKAQAIIHKYRQQYPQLARHRHNKHGSKSNPSRWLRCHRFVPTSVRLGTDWVRSGDLHSTVYDDNGTWIATVSCEWMAATGYGPHPRVAMAEAMRILLGPSLQQIAALGYV